MNITDAKKIRSENRCKNAVPVHWGMFDELDPTEFDLEKCGYTDNI